jgi:uncharacterized membrane protein YeiH
MNEVIYALDLIGVGVFAISGALAAAQKRLDILGFVLFGSITGIGGGTVRDLLLNSPDIFWIADTSYIWVAIGASILTWMLAKPIHSLRSVLLWADALGLALFCVLGTIKALAWDAPAIVAVVMGMMTATFGSLIRDSLLGREPVLLEPDIYVTAALLGSVSYVVMITAGIFTGSAMYIAIALAFLLRGGAILFDLRLPKFSGHDVSE